MKARESSKKYILVYTFMDFHLFLAETMFLVFMVSWRLFFLFIQINMVAPLEVINKTLIERKALALKNFWSWAQK